MNTDTPRTNDIIEQIKGFRTSSAIYSLEQFSRTLENELTSAQNKIQTLSEIGIDQMDKERALKSELKTVTDQLTKAHETIGTMIDEIGMLQLKDKATTEQRDMLAEALHYAMKHMRHTIHCQARASQSLHPCNCLMQWSYDNATEALQSLNQPTEP